MYIIWIYMELCSIYCAVDIAEFWKKFQSRTSEVLWVIWVPGKSAGWGRILVPLASECSWCYQSHHTLFISVTGTWNSSPREHNSWVAREEKIRLLVLPRLWFPPAEFSPGSFRAKWSITSLSGNQGPAPAGGIQGWLQWPSRESWPQSCFCSVAVFMCCSLGKRQCIDPNELIICSLVSWLSTDSVLEKDSKASDPTWLGDVQCSWEIWFYVHGFHPKKDTREPFKDSFYLFKALSYAFRLLELEFLSGCT